ncbi:MBOAT family O-acyltransferase [Mucilaginibacter sp. X5P1]|uniref:MBOAT family O-acyltransferase n=1 Tax=Mucilaginibacter sp. X5P1 TaxID=2723088 RepID=UPI0016165FF8|nr:MBOAT family protein [Mucilaginibacter sp. X5P1]MBB6141469.1 D-alanyl-lipoteichoic acid acyltransferase DltB (MBOAT superfamily) [Mucilaginibacter sp. X5P1]
MLFNSPEFVVFFVILFFLYWFIVNRNLKLQNILLLVGCYVFYCWWDWHFLSLLISTSLLNFILGHYMGKDLSVKTKRTLLGLGVVTAIASLVYFKYTDFFIESFVGLLSALHVSYNLHVINILLPLGISFYTFRTLSYLFDIQRGKIKPTEDWVVFFSYVAFFPSVISGPIDRAGLLIPQLEKKRVFDYANAADGAKQITWGLFKKMVIADNCAMISNQIFSSYQTLPASSLIVGAFFYTIQIYADFSGYSDMAIGIARLLGFNITRNFEYPFFAQNIAEFWRKWHMSLTSWLTDYVFSPLSIAFRDYGKFGLILAILINFTIIGIWHGANWTFVLFGVLHGIYYIPLILNGTLNKKKKLVMGKVLPSFKEFRNMLGTFILVMFTFILFRSDSISQAVDFYKDLFSKSLFSIPTIFPADSVTNLKRATVFFTSILIVIMLCIEWLQRDKPHPLQFDFIKSKVLRVALYYTLIFVILLFGSSKIAQFIYFKF